MTCVSFFVPGIPKAQPRPRSFVCKGRVRVYDAGTAESWKSDIAIAARAALAGHKFEGPIYLMLYFYMPRPKSHFIGGKLRYSAPVRHTSKPDLDNLEKAVMDALTNIGAWNDDSQVCVKRGFKVYCNQESCTGAKIIIKSIEGPSE